jgi:hypothetical protein
MALVTRADLKTYMDIDLTLRQEDACDMILSGLQSELETYLGRKIEAASVTEVHVLDSTHVGVPMGSFFYNTDGYDTGSQPLTYTHPPSTIYLRESPVNSITSVKLTPVSPGSTQVTLTEGTEWVGRRFGVDVYRGYANDSIEIIYNAGLAGASIPTFKLMILRAATREMQNMHDDVVGLKDLETRNVAPLETGFTDRELLAVKRHRRVRVA